MSGLILFGLPMLASLACAIFVARDKEFQRDLGIKTYFGIIGIFLLGCLPGLSFAIMLLLLGFIIIEYVRQGKAPKWIYLDKK